MRAIRMRDTAAVLTLLAMVSAEVRAQHGGGHGGAALGALGAGGTVAGQFGNAGFAPNGLGGVNIPAYGAVSPAASGPVWAVGYGYGYGSGYGYGTDSFAGMGMSPMDQEAMKQSRLMNIQAQAQLASTLAQESQVRMMIAQQKASRPARDSREGPKKRRSPAPRVSADEGEARQTDASTRLRPSLDALVGLNTVRWPVHGFSKATLAIRAQADKAVMQVHAEVADRGHSQAATVSNARIKLAEFRTSARRQLPVNSRTLVQLDGFLRVLDGALGASLAEPATGGRLLADR